MTSSKSALRVEKESEKVYWISGIPSLPHPVMFRKIPEGSRDSWIFLLGPMYNAYSYLQREKFGDYMKEYLYSLLGIPCCGKPMEFQEVLERLLQCRN